MIGRSGSDPIRGAGRLPGSRPGPLRQEGRALEPLHPSCRPAAHGRVVTATQALRTLVSGPTEPGDEDLEGRWRAGSSQAFDALFRRHYRGVVAYALRYAGDLSTAEDLAQQAFLNVLNSRPGSGRFKSLVYTVVRNLALNERRRQGRDYAPRGSLDGSEVDAGPRPALEGLVQDEEARAVRAALERLEPEEREAFCLKESEGLTYPEVGKLMNLHPDAVRRRVSRAFAKIRRLLRLSAPEMEERR